MSPNSSNYLLTYTIYTRSLRYAKGLVMNWWKSRMTRCVVECTWASGSWWDVVEERSCWESGLVLYCVWLFMCWWYQWCWIMHRCNGDVVDDAWCSWFQLMIHRRRRHIIDQVSMRSNKHTDEQHYQGKIVSYSLGGWSDASDAAACTSINWCPWRVKRWCLIFVYRR